ncbi:MAG TPA: hypothetical protein VGD17_16225 [Chitinophagaceae bacterium]
MRIVCILALLILTSCVVSTSSISYRTTVPPRYVPENKFERVLLLSSFDPGENKFRKNKEDLFKDILDSLLRSTGSRIRANSESEIIVLPGVTPVSSDSSIKALMLQNNASHAIVLKNFNVFFSQTRVEVTKTESGKNREAFYDIIAEADYAIYDHQGLFKNIPVSVSQFHSSRTVLSGLLAAGPDIVANYKRAFGIAVANTEKFLNNFFPSTAQRSRPVFTQKEFAAVGTAISRDDYEAALIESMKLVNHPDKKLAAMANYNCAVFMERKNQHENSREYLKQSIKLSSLVEARFMLSDLDE